MVTIEVSPIPPARMYDFLQAVKTAKQHIPIVLEVSSQPGSFAIVNKGDCYAVYGLDSFVNGQRPGGFLPPSPITGKLVATMDLQGVVSYVESAA